MNEPVRVACVQAEPVILDREATLAKLDHLAAEAAGHGAQLLVFPETILGPDGGYLAGPLYDEEGILYADLDPARLWEERQRFDPAGHYHGPDVLSLTVTARD